MNSKIWIVTVNSEQWIQKNIENLKLKGISTNSQVSTAFYFTKNESSSSFVKNTNDEDGDSDSVDPSINDFETNHLRVINVFNPDFEIDLQGLYDEFVSKKHRAKRHYYQNTFAQSEKDRIRRKRFEKNERVE